MDYCFEQMDDLVKAKTLDNYESFLLGYCVAKNGAYLLPRLSHIFTILSQMKVKNQIIGNQLHNIYNILFQGEFSQVL